MSEGVEHILLKAIGRKILEFNGFREIIEEYPIEALGNPYRVDIVGIKPISAKRDFKVAIECGGLSLEKKQALEVTFNKVIWLTVEDILTRYLKYIEDYEKMKSNISKIRDILTAYEFRLDDDIINRLLPTIKFV